MLEHIFHVRLGSQIPVSDNSLTTLLFLRPASAMKIEVNDLVCYTIGIMEWRQMTPVFSGF